VDEAPSDRAGGYRWLIGVWSTVVVFAIVTAVWSEHVGIPLRDPDGIIFQRRLLTAVGLLVVLALVDAMWRAKRGGGSLRQTSRVLKEKWTGTRITLALTGLLAYHFIYVCYRNLKSWDAFNTPRDDDLLSFDKWLFLGHSPAVLLHDLIGTDTAAPILAVVYSAFTNLVPLSFVAALVFANRIRDGYVLLTAAIWVWILGIISYYAIPTLGPFASAPEEFSSLTHTGITDTQAKYLHERAHLLADPSAHDAFASISAFASLHVAYTCMVVFMLRYYGFRLASQLLAVYLVGVMVATVYFGWHFFVDDIAGVAVAALAVLIAHVMIYPGRPLRRTPATPR
jgi:membrane-associated phospholipid phosphatase